MIGNCGLCMGVWRGGLTRLAALLVLSVAVAQPVWAQIRIGPVKLPVGGSGGALSAAARDKLDKYILPLGRLRTVAAVANGPVHPALNRTAVMFLQRVDYYNYEVNKYYPMLRDTDKANPEMVAAMARVREVVDWRNRVADNINAGAKVDPKSDVLPPVTDWQVQLQPGQPDPFTTRPGTTVSGCVAANPKAARDQADVQLVEAEWEQDDAARQAKLDHANAYRKYVARQAWGIPGYGSYPELAGKADKLSADLEAAFPKVDPTQPKSAADVVAGYEAVQAKTAEAKAFYTALTRVSACADFAGKWNTLAGAKINNRIADHAKPMVDVLYRSCGSHLDQPEEVARKLAAPAADLTGLHNQFSDVLHLFTRAEPVVALLPALPVWAQFVGKNPTTFTTLVNANRNSVAKCAESTTFLQGPGAQTLLKMIELNGMAKGGSDAKNEKIARGFLAQAIAIKASGGDSDSEDRIVTKGDKAYKVKFAWKDFQVDEVSKVGTGDDAGFKVAAVPGLPADLCYVKFVNFRMYTKGVDVSLNSWDFNGGGNATPMLCQNAKRASPLP